MARKLRVEYPGAIYHVMNRGDRREPIFKDDRYRRRFIMAAPRTVAAGQCREERDGGHLKPQWAGSPSYHGPVQRRTSGDCIVPV
jgi:hypothetical protein